jgi:hypothetical protein
MPVIIPTIIAVHIESAESTFKPRINQPQAVTVIEDLVHSAPSSSEFQPFTFERPVYHPLWKVSKL